MRVLLSIPGSGASVWDPATASSSISAGSADDTVAISKNGETVATVSSEGVLSVSRVIEGDLRQIGTTKLGRIVPEEARLELSATGRYCLWMPSKDSAILLELTDATNVKQYKWQLNADNGSPYALSFDLREANASVSYDNGHIIRLDLIRKLVFEYRPFEETPIAALARGNLMAAVTTSGAVWLLDSQRAERHCVIHLDDDTVIGADLSPDGAFLATISKTGFLQVLEVAQCQWVDSSYQGVRTHKLYGLKE